MGKLKAKWLWQQGNILVISIISLVVLAGLSVAILSTSVGEKKLASNDQDTLLAKQAADYAVSVAKKDLLEKWAVGMCECATAPCSCPTTAPWVWLTTQFVNADPVDALGTWWNNFGTAVNKPSAQLFSAPQYIIIDLGCDVVANVYRFRIVGRGVGAKQESVAFVDETMTMPFNAQNAGSGQTTSVNAILDGGLQTTFTMANFTASAPFYQVGTKCQAGSSFAQCEMNCAGQVRVMTWTADSHCIPTYGPWADVGVLSTVKVSVTGAPHTVTCQKQAAQPPAPPPGGGTENPGDHGKHKGDAYGNGSGNGGDNEGSGGNNQGSGNGGNNQGDNNQGDNNSQH